MSYYIFWLALLLQFGSILAIPTAGTLPGRIWKKILTQSPFNIISATVPVTIAQDFIDSYHHSLKHDFEKDGESAKWAPGHPKKWGSENAKISLPWQENPNSIALSHDGGRLAVAAGSEIHIYNASTLEHQKTLRGHRGHVSHIELHPDGETFVSSSDVNGASRETMVRLWNLTYELQWGSEGTGFTSIDEKAAATAMDELLEQGIWSSEDVKTEAGSLVDEVESVLRGAEARRDVRDGRAFIGTIPSFGSRAFSDDGSLLFYIDARMTAVARDVATRTERFRMAHSDAIMWVGQSPDGKYVGTSSWDRTLKIWDAQSGELVRTLLGSQNQNWAAAFSPDSKLIAAGSGDQSIYVWNVETGDLIHRLSGFTGWIRTLMFSKDGTYLAAGAAGGTVRVFDVRLGESIQYWQIDDSRHLYLEVSNLQYTPEWTKLAFKNSDGSLVIYDFEENVKWEFEQNEGHGRYFGSDDLVFTSDGRTAISADQDGSVRFWKL